MKRKSLLFLLVAFLFCCLFVTNLFAQGQTRVIEEELIIKDPTVAQPQKWLVGGSGDLWWVYGRYTEYDSSGAEYSTGNINGFMYGGTIYAGYDNLTLTYSYRRGSWDIVSTTVDAPYFTYKTTDEQAEHEITARWLFRVHPHFNPYILAGYNHTTKKSTVTLTTEGDWGIFDYTFKSPLIGLGAIIPFNKYIGLRVDGRLMYSWGELKYQDGTSVTGSGVGGAVVGTVYWNIWQGLNLQVGGKYQYLNAGTDVGYFGKMGVYGMLGYTFKF